MSGPDEPGELDGCGMVIVRISWVMLSVVLLGAAIAKADDGADDGRRERATLVLSHAALVECEARPRICGTDWAAIPHVLIKRQATRPALQGLELAEVARRYSVPLRRRTARARRIMRYPLGAPRYWAAVVATVRGVLRGDVVDPCVPAVHWGGAMDKPSPKLVRVCKRVPTRNRLYAVTP